MADEPVPATPILPGTDSGYAEGGEQRLRSVTPAGFMQAPRDATTTHPFIGPSQTTRVRAICVIIVGGVDVTAKLKPHLINVHIVDEGVAQAHIELDDRDKSLPLPPRDAPVTIMLGWKYESMVAVFKGRIHDVEHAFGRTAGGRRMFIHAYSVSFMGHIKTPGMAAEGEGAEPGQQEGKKIKLETMFSKVMQQAGFQSNVHKDLNIGRDYWQQMSESPMQWTQSVADAIGGLAIFRDKEAIITKRGVNADGSSTGVIYAVWGDNLVAWRVHPYVTRTTYAQGQQQSYDHLKAAWSFLSQKFGSPMTTGKEGSVVPNGPAANESNAQQDNQGSENTAEGSTGDGRIVINGEPKAAFNCRVEVRGARPGVDGLWWCFSVEHLYSREGYVTWLNVKPEWTSRGAISEGGRTSDGKQRLTSEPNVLHGISYWTEDDAGKVLIQDWSDLLDMKGIQA